MGRCHRNSAWTNYPCGLQTVGTLLNTVSACKFSSITFEGSEAGVMRPDLSERPTVTPADLKVVVRPLVNHLHPTEVPLRYRLNSRLVGGVKANLGVCQDGRHPKFKYRRTVSPSVRVVTNTPPDCGADRQNLLHHTLRDRVGGSHRRSWAAASFAIGAAGLTAVPGQ